MAGEWGRLRLINHYECQKSTILRVKFTATTDDDEYVDQPSISKEAALQYHYQQPNEQLQSKVCPLQASLIN